jgi:hypothetical protein
MQNQFSFLLHSISFLYLHYSVKNIIDFLLFMLWTLSLERNILERRIRKEQQQVDPTVAN